MEESPMSDQITPDTILQLGFGFWGSKVLLSAVELGVFSVLAPGPLDAQTLIARLGLHPRSARDFLDALVALRLIGPASAFKQKITVSRFLPFHPPY